MSPLTLSAPRLATLAWVIVGAGYLVALAVPSAMLPSDTLGLRRFPTPAITSDMPLAQTFEMTADGLHAIDVHATSPDGAVSGVVQLALWDVTGGEDRLVRSEDVGAVDLAGAAPYRFTFPPIADSNSRLYRLEFLSSPASPAHGVALLATKGERYAGGSLLIRGEPRWADLAFEAHAPAPSGWVRLMSRGASWVPMKGYVVLVAFGANWIALGVLLQAIAWMPDAKTRGAR